MKQPFLEHARAWFTLTNRERIALAAILALFLFGLVFRYAALRREKPEPAIPPGVEWAE